MGHGARLFRIADCETWNPPEGWEFEGQIYNNISDSKLAFLKGNSILYALCSMRVPDLIDTNGALL